MPNAASPGKHAPARRRQPAKRAIRERPATGAATLDDYIATSSPDVQPVLQRIRETIRKAAPEAEEAISYRIPVFVWKGSLIFFAAFKNHIGIYPPVRGDERLQRALEKYAGPQGN